MSLLCMQTETLLVASFDARVHSDDSPITDGDEILVKEIFQADGFEW